MNMAHIVVVDYDGDRRKRVTDAVSADSGVVVHEAVTRTQALGIIYQLAVNGITPRAIFSAWLLDDPDSRAFYKLLEREIDLTCLTLLAHCVQIDASHSQVTNEHATLVCYVPSAYMEEALFNIREDGLSSVVIIDESHGDQLEGVAKALYCLDRERAVRRYSVDYEPSSGSSAYYRTASDHATTVRKAGMRKLSRQ